MFYVSKACKENLYQLHFLQKLLKYEFLLFIQVFDYSTSNNVVNNVQFLAQTDRFAS